MRCYLIDGPLMTTPERRAARVEAMAFLLRQTNAYADRGDAVRFLMARGFSTLDILLLVDDARQVAVQDVVAREMGAS